MMMIRNCHGASVASLLLAATVFLAPASFAQQP